MIDPHCPSPETFSDGLMEGLREAIAWKRGRLAFEVFNIEAMPPERVRTIRVLLRRACPNYPSTAEDVNRATRTAAGGKGVKGSTTAIASAS